MIDMDVKNTAKDTPNSPGVCRDRCDYDANWIWAWMARFASRRRGVGFVARKITWGSVNRLGVFAHISKAPCLLEPVHV
jgi:hypothetical protein